MIWLSACVAETSGVGKGAEVFSTVGGGGLVGDAMLTSGGLSVSVGSTNSVCVGTALGAVEVTRLHARVTSIRLTMTAKMEYRWLLSNLGFLFMGYSLVTS